MTSSHETVVEIAEGFAFSQKFASVSATDDVTHLQGLSHYLTEAAETLQMTYGTMLPLLQKELQRLYDERLVHVQNLPFVQAVLKRQVPPPESEILAADR